VVIGFLNKGCLVKMQLVVRNEGLVKGLWAVAKEESNAPKNLALYHQLDWILMFLSMLFWAAIFCIDFTRIDEI